MKRKLILVALAILLIATLGGCGSEPREYICYRKVIPDSLKLIAAERIETILATVKVQSRVDDEDTEDWIKQAEETVIEIYGEMEIGIGDKDSWKAFKPYSKCSKAQQDWIDRFLAEQR